LSRRCISRKYFDVVPCSGRHEVIESCWDGTPKVWRDCKNGAWVYDHKNCVVPKEGQVLFTKVELTPIKVELWEKDWRVAIDVQNIGKTYTRYGINVYFDNHLTDYRIRAWGANGLPWNAKKNWELHFNYPDMLGLSLGEHVMKIESTTLGHNPKVFDTIEIPFEITHDYGSGKYQIAFTSKPDAASVRLDGKYVITTPCRLNLNDGRYAITIDTYGYWAREFDIEVNENCPKKYFIELIEKPEEG